MWEAHNCRFCSSTGKLLLYVLIISSIESRASGDDAGYRELERSSWMTFSLVIRSGPSGPSLVGATSTRSTRESERLSEMSGFSIQYQTCGGMWRRTWSRWPSLSWGSFCISARSSQRGTISLLHKPNIINSPGYLHFQVSHEKEGKGTKFTYRSCSIERKNGTIVLKEARAIYHCAR